LLQLLGWAVEACEHLCQGVGIGAVAKQVCVFDIDRGMPVCRVCMCAVREVCGRLAYTVRRVLYVWVAATAPLLLTWG
jgi:hypothetical protein